MHRQRSAKVRAVFALALVTGAVLAPQSPAATREPLPQALSGLRNNVAPTGPTARPSRTAALRAMTRGSASRYAAAGYEFKISSTYYGPAAIDSVAATLRSLDHGPELAQLSVYVATPTEIESVCGTTVVACYLPTEKEMVVSGIDRPVAGVPRDFAIAHEYGHHIANSEESSALPAIDAGTIRWATYERVCQLTRSGRLFPGNQGAHYWEDPEEAFAQSYAHLARPSEGVSWQYTSLLEPTSASLAKIHADIARPWSGPVGSSWSGSVTEPPTAAGGSAVQGARAGRLAIGSGRAVADRSWIDSHTIRTPLDGQVSVSLESSPGTALQVNLRDPERGRVLARVATGPEGAANLSYANCGHDSLDLEVRSTTGAAGFRAAITRP